MKAHSPGAGVHAAIAGVGGYLPERVVPSREIGRRIGASTDWIVRRTGIRERRFAGPDETVPVMGHAAATKALAAAGIPPDAVDCIIVATMTHLIQAPAAATEIAELLGAGANVAAAFDLNAACAGFCYSVNLARNMVATGSARNVVVVGAERMSDVVDPTDRDSAFLFGDGAGAVVIAPADEPGIGPAVWGSDSARRSVIVQPARWPQLKECPDTPWPYLDIAGPAVFRWAVTEMGRVARAAMDASGVTPAELTAFVPHQANMRITDALVAALDLPPDVVVARNIEDTGNTSAASVPLAMDRLLNRTPGMHGGLALLIGFGAGLLYAGQVVRLP
jgi:3-oxoacyl-[acyl-carrier-protein] synthase-3